MERIRAKYPDVVIQACGSGGGRVSYGVMPYFDEFWVSDNTDALQRLFIQWGPLISILPLRWRNMSVLPESSDRACSAA